MATDDVPPPFETRKKLTLKNPNSPEVHEEETYVSTRKGDKLFIKEHLKSSKDCSKEIYISLYRGVKAIEADKDVLKAIKNAQKKFKKLSGSKAELSFEFDLKLKTEGYHNQTVTVHRDLAVKFNVDTDLPEQDELLGDMVDRLSSEASSSTTRDNINRKFNDGIRCRKVLIPPSEIKELALQTINSAAAAASKQIPANKKSKKELRDEEAAFDELLGANSTDASEHQSVFGGKSKQLFVDDVKGLDSKPAGKSAAGVI